jgi:serine/threonine-protein kinase RsbW
MMKTMQKRGKLSKSVTGSHLPATGTGHRPDVSSEGLATVEIRIPASSRYIGVVRETVDAISADTLMSPGDRAAVRLAVGEACNNAVLHAHRLPDANRSDVTVQCRIKADALEIVVVNEGVGPMPHAGSKMPDPLAESGRGMALIEAMMDSVQFLTAEGKTILRMRKFLSQNAPAFPSSTSG